MSRSGHGWGPFSGAQLTTMVCVIVAAVAFPVGAWAVVTGSNVFVTDATSGAHAAVSSSGALTVAGSVTSNNASPKSLYVNSSIPGATYVPAAAPPSGKALIVTSIAVDTDGPASFGSGSHAEFVISAADATCGTQAPGLVGFVSPSALGVTSIAIPSGLVVPAKRALCVAADGIVAVVTVYGYLVPAASAPTGT